MPSPKYSWDASPVRFSKGSTASQRMTGAGLGLTMRRSESRQLHPATAAASITHAMLGHSHQGRGPDRTMEMDRAEGGPTAGAPAKGEHRPGGLRHGSKWARSPRCAHD